MSDRVARILAQLAPAAASTLPLVCQSDSAGVSAAPTSASSTASSSPPAVLSTADLCDDHGAAVSLLPYQLNENEN